MKIYVVIISFPLFTRKSFVCFVVKFVCVCRKDFLKQSEFEILFALI